MFTEALRTAERPELGGAFGAGMPWVLRIMPGLYMRYIYRVI